MKSSNIGGQAVLEGVMMKNGDQYAVAVRKPERRDCASERSIRWDCQMEETDKDSICARNLQFCRFSRAGNEDTLLFGKFLRGRREGRTNREGSGEKGEAGEFDYGDHNGMFGSDRGCNLYGSSLLAVKSFETVCAGQICQDCYRGNREDCSVYRIYPADLEDEGYSARVHVSWSRT